MLLLPSLSTIHPPAPLRLASLTPCLSPTAPQPQPESQRVAGPGWIPVCLFVGWA